MSSALWSACRNRCWVSTRSLRDLRDLLNRQFELSDSKNSVKPLDGNNNVSKREVNNAVRSDIVAARGEVRSPEALGRMLQQGRLVRRLTQRELADRLETDQKYIWSLESGKTTIVLERIFAMAREDGHWVQVLDDYPSTHIVKSPSMRTTHHRVRRAVHPRALSQTFY